jgi:hypothetical protein
MTSADGVIRHDWTIDEIVVLHDLPLLELIGRANAVHLQHHDPNKVQKASLLSIKTGGCPENCAYCPQSAHHREVDLTRDRLMDPAKVIALAERAKEAGAERFCMGAASPPASTMTAWIHWQPSGPTGLTSAAAASLVWARRSATEPRCCRFLRAWSPIPKACRSTPLFPSKARPWPDDRA